MADQAIEIATLDPATTIFVQECELTGKRSVMLRNGKPVAILLSMDEYIALQETIALAASPELQSEVKSADEEIGRAKMLLAEDLFGE
jgi:PHD/YefM family antitoxin component YafN of YafNO toxin-antitoxin module